MAPTARSLPAEKHSLSPLDLCCIIVPTLNATPMMDRLLPALRHQGVPGARIYFIDSASDDATVKRAKEFGAKVEVIRRSSFNHGGTRRYACTRLPEAEFFVFLTQDAIPASSDAIKRLLAAFADPAVGMAYGRQLPRPEARGIERHARLCNYPAQSQVRSLEDRARLGARTVFCSNSFAAYRREALEAVGGFPEDMFFGEDQVVAGKMLIAGWKLAYQADACVFHSHDYSIRQEFNRYFDVGVFHARNPWILETFGKVEGEGMRYVRSEISYLARREALSIPSAILRSAVKYAAYHIGKREARLPPKWKSRLSMQPSYWLSGGT